VVGFVFCSLQYCVGALECYFGVCLFEEVGDLPNFSAVICEGGLKMATLYRINQEIKFLYIKKAKLNEQLHKAH
jgi:hypothetical protein